MNAVEIEEAISALSEQPFDLDEFPYAFLLAFGNKETTIKRLRTGASNKSDIDGVLQTNNIHLKTCAKGQVAQTLAALKASPATNKSKAKFILATDGIDLEAEDITTGDTIACAYTDFPDHFGFFLPLAGISTVKQIRESAFDIRATSRLNRLYVELIKDNPEWGTAERRHDMNHFMARLIFCFFAEDTDIFNEEDLFTATIDRMSERDGSNTHEIIEEIFRAMNTAGPDRAGANLPRWAEGFPYVNGGLFSGSTEAPRFSKIAQRYLSHIGSLDWTQINPDIFGSMIQAVADDEERGALGMHYTSVPNILKVLNPLFLDDLRTDLEAAGDNPRKLANLRDRMAKIRVFDPACGSGNFLVIAYKEIRALEFELNKKRGEPERRSDIPLTNYRGIELRDFSAEIARLALIIAEYQCDVTYRGQKEALAEFLPLDAQNWITCGNALRLDWLSICPPTGTGIKVASEDLFDTALEQAEIDFKNEGGETYICGNPPYKGTNWRSKEQTIELGKVLDRYSKQWKSLDYVNGWMIKAAEYSKFSQCSIAFVTTNSICQGQQAAVLWPILFNHGLNIYFAHRSFKWANLASHNAGVSVVIVGMKSSQVNAKSIFEEADGVLIKKEAVNINGYLLDAPSIHVSSSKSSLGMFNHITDGSGALDGGHLILDSIEAESIRSLDSENISGFVKPYQGSSEFIKGTLRYCLWITDADVDRALSVPEIQCRVKKVRDFRQTAGSRAQTAIDRPHKFAWINKQKGNQIIVPTVFSEKREYLTVGFLSDDVIISNAASIVQDADLATFSILSSKLHIEWVRSVAGKLEDRLRYTSSTCYNTFPAPKLTEKNKADLTVCAEDILLAREAHFPATIADLYNPETMPENLRAAHARNDEVLERIYIGRRFRNDTERLEKLFEMYTKMTTKVSA